MKTKKIKEICNKHNFSCNITKEKGHMYEIEMSVYTKYDQDWCCSFYASNNEMLLDMIYNFLDTYDADYEASLWIGDDGHGMNGAPYHIADIVDDMQDGWNKLDALYNDLRKAIE